MRLIIQLIFTTMFVMASSDSSAQEPRGFSPEEWEALDGNTREGYYKLRGYYPWHSIDELRTKYTSDGYDWPATWLTFPRRAFKYHTYARPAPYLKDEQTFVETGESVAKELANRYELEQSKLDYSLQSIKVISDRIVEINKFLSQSNFDSSFNSFNEFNSWFPSSRDENLNDSADKITSYIYVCLKGEFPGSFILGPSSNEPGRVAIHFVKDQKLIDVHTLFMDTIFLLDENYYVGRLNSLEAVARYLILQIDSEHDF